MKVDFGYTFALTPQNFGHRTVINNQAYQLKAWSHFGLAQWPYARHADILVATFVVVTCVYRSLINTFFVPFPNTVSVPQTVFSI